MEERITTAGILIDGGRVLVGKRINEGAIGGRWEFPGGKNRWGETLGDTISREWDEELGVSVHMVKELTGHDFVNKETLYHLRALLIESDSTDFELRMHDELRFVGSEEIMTLDFAPSDEAVRDWLISEGYIK